MFRADSLAGPGKVDKGDKACMPSEEATIT
jgi:hypothetical protein